MHEVSSNEALFSITTKKKFGRPYSYGRSVFGFSGFGDAGIYSYLYGFGCSEFARDNYGAIDELTGIFQTRHGLDGPVTVLMEYYWPKNPRSVPQQANRSKFGDAVAGYQSLTASAKAIYTERANKLKITGYNLYLREYLLSH